MNIYNSYYIIITAHQMAHNSITYLIKCMHNYMILTMIYNDILWYTPNGTPFNNLLNYSHAWLYTLYYTITITVHQMAHQSTIYCTNKMHNYNILTII